MRLAVVGITGLVGQTILKVLDELNFQYDELIGVASEKNIGKVLKISRKQIKIISIEDAIEMRPNIAIFSAGKTVSREYAQRFAAVGTYVVDNSSAWRMDDNIKLIVPEVNISLLTKEDKIIANPNCSTIQLVVILNALHQKYRLKRVVVSTYQSVTGTGQRGINQLNCEQAGVLITDLAYPYQINRNCIPHGGVFLDNGYTEEEMKLTNESRKILGLPNLPLTATVVRIPVTGGHSESVNIEFEKKPKIVQVLKILGETNGVVLKNEPSENLYPMPINAEGKNDIFVGRIRADNSRGNALNLWIVADNLRKGAATNAVQIAQYIQNNFI
jgi:aspartate-semialdehyde dehydrogenase